MGRSPLTVAAFIPFAAVSVIHLTAKLSGDVPLDRATKGLTVPALILAVLIVLLANHIRLPRPVLAALVAGLTLSWIGDITLADFTTGLSFFLLAHVAYIVLFHLAFARRISWWSLGLLPWYAGLLLALWPFLGDLAGVVALYGLILGLMAAAATRGNALTMLGGTLFVASDSLLAFRMFTPLFQTPAEDVVIMGLYLAAQLFITVGVLRTARPRTARPTTDS